MSDLLTVISWYVWLILILMFFAALIIFWIDFCKACKKWWKGELSDEEKEKQKEIDEAILQSSLLAVAPPYNLNDTIINLSFI